MTAVIAAAGSGERLGAGGPKAFVPVGGRPMVEWSIEAMRAAPSVRSIVVACPPGVRPAPERSSSRIGGQSAFGREGREGLIEVDGGATRAESVANALEAVETELVAIHDAARPLVTSELIEAVVAALAGDPKADGAIAATPVTDTIKQVEPSSAPGPADSALVVESTVDRDRLWAAQTPQVFRADALRRALAAGDGRDSATDEAMLIEAAGGRVLIYPSPPENLKVTRPHDLRVAELLLAERRAS